MPKISAQRDHDSVLPASNIGHIGGGLSLDVFVCVEFGSVAREKNNRAKNRLVISNNGIDSAMWVINMAVHISSFGEPERTCHPTGYGNKRYYKDGGYRSACQSPISSEHKR